MSVTVQATLVKSVARIEIDIGHVTEDGRRVDPKTGKTVPADFVQQVRLRAHDQTLAECNLGAGLSDNPVLVFKARGLKAGTPVSVEWTDSKGASGTSKTVVAGGGR